VLTLLSLASYIVHTISYLRDRTCETYIQTATSARRGMRAQVTQGGLIPPVLFSLYVNDMPSPSHRFEIALYVDTAIITTSRKSTLLVSYLESYLNDFQLWLSEWRIAINFSKSNAIIFALDARRFIQPRPVKSFGEPIQWIDTTHYLGGEPRYTTQLVNSHRSGQKVNCSKDGFVGSPE